ncbi:hypothetical protein AAXB25_14380 [Paenibacillus lautus]|uniref:hypothetical protein n=1 Tax=Paenibacillus lautus TaxID=1401 RepID=UPI003D2E7FC9
MKMTAIIECECGNFKAYRVKEVYDVGEKYLDFSETMDDEQFVTHADPQGSTIRCIPCGRSVDVI